MKRRDFIFCTALSVGSLVRSYSSPVDSYSFSPEKTFQDYLKVIGANGEFKLLADEQLNEICKLKSSSHLQTGYKPHGSKFYFCSDEKVAICPLFLGTSNSKIIDISVLFFRKDASNDWIYCNTFSGFHLESIVQAIPNLDNNYTQNQLADLLVPVEKSSATNLPYTVFTKTGRINLVVHIQDQKTIVDFKLVENHENILAKKYESIHTLNHNSLT